jgi:hypothetical protein
MHLVGQCSNPSAPLRAIFEALPDEPILRKAGSPARVAPEPKLLKLGNGVVQDAVVKVLEGPDGPMHCADIHLAVERLLGHPVSKNSVRWCLAAGARASTPRFERTAPGWYRLPEAHP